MRLFPFILCCAVQAVRGYDGPPPLTEVDGRSPIRMGGELLGGYRSDYIHRGEKLGPNSVEAQISAGATLAEAQLQPDHPARGAAILSGGRVHGRTVCQRAVV